MIKVIKLLLYVFTGVFFWELIVRIFEFPDFILPSPFKVWQQVINNYDYLFHNFTITFIESFTGFLVANFIAFFIGIIISFNRNLEKIVMPLAITLKTFPVIAIAPVLVLWFGPGINSKIASAAFVCFFPSLVNILRGVRSIDIFYHDLFRVMNASKIQIAQHLVIPSISPYMFAALKISSSLSIIGALAGELVSANKGLGFVIIMNYYSLNIPLVFGALCLLSIMGILLYYILEAIENKVIFWAKIN